MTTSHFPLKVLGLLGPFLSWVEGVEGLRYREEWLQHRLSTAHRDEAWLVRELPTYSLDTVAEIVRASRTRRGQQPSEEARGRLPTLLHAVHRRQRQIAPPPGYALDHAMKVLSDRYFEWRGSEVVVRQRRMVELHELALRFPVDHLVRHRHAREVAAGTLSRERALRLPSQLPQLHSGSHGLRAVVGRGLTEGHLHLWGVLDASEIWADHLLRHLDPGMLEDFDPEERRLFRLARAAARLLALALLMAHFTPDEEAPPFEIVTLLDRLYFAANQVEEDHLLQRLREQFRRAATVRRNGSQEATPPDGFEDWSGGADREEPREFLRRALASDDPIIEALLRIADPIAYRLKAHRYRGSRVRAAHEGIRDRLRCVSTLHLVAHEHLLAVAAEGDGTEAPPPPVHDLVQQAFFRYLVLQTHHLQLGTQSGKTTGLRYFKRFYDARQRDPLDRDEREAQSLILERLRTAGHLHTLEGRIRPPESTDDLIPWILGYAEGVRRGEFEGFGLVVHFLKAEKQDVEDRKLPHTGRRVRHGRIRRHVRAKAKNLFRLLSRSHPAVPFIVGIDAANLELTTPPEVFAPAFRFLRDLPIEARPLGSPWDRFHTHFEVAELIKERRLGLTYHVGEDFRHLVSGLRAIHEVLTFLRPTPGDRLGHAIALALDPDVWAQQNGYQAVVPKLEALDDLVWLLHFLGSGNDTVGRLGFEDDIQRLSQHIYGASPLPHELRLRELERLREDRSPGATPPAEPPQVEWNWSPLDHHNAWLLRQLDPYSLDLSAAVQGKAGLRALPASSAQMRRWLLVQQRTLEELDRRHASRSAYHLLSLYWYHDEVRRRGAELVNLDMQEKWPLWRQLCRQVQERLKEEIERRQLIVEVNPSSNRTVGPMSRFGEHHVFDMTLGEDGTLDRRLRVTVNTDDPGVFNTSLPHEYYLLGEILIYERGVPEPKVEEWLEWLRKNGEDSSFVRSLPRASDPRVMQILDSLTASEQPVSRHWSGSDLLAAFWRRRSAGEREARAADAARRLRRLERQLGLGTGDDLQHRIEQLEKRFGIEADTDLAARIERLERWGGVTP